MGPIFSVFVWFLCFQTIRLASVLAAACCTFLHRSQAVREIDFWLHLAVFSVFLIGQPIIWPCSMFWAFQVEYIGQEGTIGGGHLIHTIEGHSKCRVATYRNNVQYLDSNIKVTICTLTSDNYISINLEIPVVKQILCLFSIHQFKETIWEYSKPLCCKWVCKSEGFHQERQANLLGDNFCTYFMLQPCTNHWLTL